MAGVALNLCRPGLLDHGVIAATDRVRGSAANVLASAGSETWKEHQSFSLKAVSQGQQGDVANGFAGLKAFNGRYRNTGRFAQLFKAPAQHCACLSAVQRGELVEYDLLKRIAHR